MPPARPPAQPDLPITFALLVFERFPLMAFSSVVEPLRAANVLAGRDCYRWTTVAPQKGMVSASNGVSVAVEHGARAAPLADRVVVCSGGNAENLPAEPAVGWIRANLRAGAQLGAVADASFFLARSGLLDGHACTLHWTSQPAFQEAFPDIELRRELFVIDRTRFTAAGGIGCLDMMLEIIRRDFGPELSAGVAEWYLHSPLRASADRSMMPARLRTGVRDPLVLAAISAMEEAVEDRLAMSALTRRLSVSPDRLERAFRAALGRSPGAYYRSLRLRRAADLLTHSTLAVGEVALACGFDSPASFTRAFREETGLSPREMRRRPSLAGEAPRRGA